MSGYTPALHLWSVTKANGTELLRVLQILLRAGINSVRRPHTWQAPHLIWSKDATGGGKGIDGSRTPLRKLTCHADIA